MRREKKGAKGIKTVFRGNGNHEKREVLGGVRGGRMK